MRLQRFLSQAGVASRRQAEELIRTGAVTVNGEPVSELGIEVSEKDRVEVSGRRVAPENPVYRLLLKPRACLSNFEDKGERATLRRYLPVQETGLTVVGPLDFPSEGVLLLTTDGALADVMSRRHQKVPMTYHLKLQGSVGSDEIERLLRGWHAEDRQLKPVSVRGLATTGKNTWIEVVVAETRPRALKAVGDLLRHTVLKISRIRFGDLSFEGLAMGEWRDLTKVEAAALREQAGLDAEDERGPASPSTSPAGKSAREGAKAGLKSGPKEAAEDGDGGMSERGRTGSARGARPVKPVKPKPKAADAEDRKRGFRGRAWAGGEPGRKVTRRPARSTREGAARAGTDTGRVGGEPSRAGKVFERPRPGRPPASTGRTEPRAPRRGFHGPSDERAPFPRGPGPRGGVERKSRPEARPASSPDSRRGERGGPERPRPGGERGPRPGSERGPRPAGERGPRPGSERGPRPAGERGPRPAGERGPRPGGERGPRPGGRERPGERSSPRPFGGKPGGRPPRR